MSKCLLRLQDPLNLLLATTTPSGSPGTCQASTGVSGLRLYVRFAIMENQVLGFLVFGDIENQVLGFLVLGWFFFSRPRQNR